MSCTTTPVLYTLSLHDALPISREVMRLLEHDGLVDVRHGSGAYVREPTDWPPDDPRHTLRAELTEVATIRTKIRHLSSGLDEVERRLNNLIRRIGHEGE